MNKKKIFFLNIYLFCLVFGKLSQENELGMEKKVGTFQKKKIQEFVFLYRNTFLIPSLIHVGLKNQNKGKYTIFCSLHFIQLLFRPSFKELYSQLEEKKLEFLLSTVSLPDVKLTPLERIDSIFSREGKVEWNTFLSVSCPLFNIKIEEMENLHWLLGIKEIKTFLFIFFYKFFFFEKCSSQGKSTLC